MVSRQDVRAINKANDELAEAIDEMEELYEREEKNGVTIEDAAYGDAQDRMKNAISDLWDVSEDAVDRTDTLELPNGKTKNLPKFGLERSRQTTNKPNGNNGNGNK